MMLTREGLGIPPDDFWNSSWFPVLDLERGFIAVDISTRTGDVWLVWFESVETDPNRRIATSLSRFLSGVADQFESGEYVWDKGEGILDSPDGFGVPFYEEDR